MHQFTIEPIFGSFEGHNPFVFTNSALWTLIVLGTIWSTAASHHVSAILPLRESLGAPSPRLLRARPPAARRRRRRSPRSSACGGWGCPAGRSAPGPSPLGGAFGMFDGESGLNPAALGRVGVLGADSPRCRTSATSRTRRAPIGPGDAIPLHRGRRPDQAVSGGPGSSASPTTPAETSPSRARTRWTCGACWFPSSTRSRPAAG